MMKKIPINRLDEGIRLCANNIRRFLQDVELLLKNSSEWHAIAMAIFAYEEIAKYAELKKAKSTATSDSVEICSRLFYDHEYKQDIAYELIEDNESVVLLAESDLLPHFQTEKVEVKPKLRLDCLFVDWCEKNEQWRHGQPYLPSNIRRFKEEIAKALDRLQSN